MPVISKPDIMAHPSGRCGAQWCPITTHTRSCFTGEGLGTRVPFYNSAPVEGGGGGVPLTHPPQTPPYYPP